MSQVVRKAVRFSRRGPVVFAALVLVVSVVAILTAAAPAASASGSSSESKIKRGFQIAPVPLDLHGKNAAMVGLGSYLVNAAGGCNDCHSCPSYTPGHDPYAGGDGQYNADNYLAGGVPVAPGVVSRNLTPDPNGRPAGLTFDQFEHTIRTGEDPENPGQVLEVMPWPVFRHMTHQDLAAIYEYLSAIPHAEPGQCGFPGQ